MDQKIGMIQGGYLTVIVILGGKNLGFLRTWAELRQNE
jgi:hypothetical protein